MSDAHMTFGFSDEQRQMRASVLGLLSRVLPPSQDPRARQGGGVSLRGLPGACRRGLHGSHVSARVRRHGRQLHGPRRARRGARLSLRRHRAGLRHHRDLCRHAHRAARLGSDEARGAAQDHFGRHAPRAVPERAGSRLRCCRHRAGRGARLGTPTFSTARRSTTVPRMSRTTWSSSPRRSPAAATTASACSWSTPLYPALRYAA